MGVRSLLPPVKTHLGEVMLSAYFRDALTAIRLSQDTDFLFCRVFLAFHVFGLVVPED